MMITLGIESSCDETSVAILRGGAVLSSVTHSQGEHALYGGVVPEVASRAHLEKIDGLARRAMDGCGITPEKINLIAVTDSPGLAGALLVGVSFALGMHTAYGIPVTGVNHLEGHICSLFIDRGDDIKPPFLVLLASGGHTAIYKYVSSGNCALLGRTVDDAAGEAFDKVGKLLGFRYPAGRMIEAEAAKFAEESTQGKREKINFPVARFSSPEKSLCFSFSGLKTAVKNFISANSENYINDNRPAVCEAFQRTVVRSLADNLEEAANLTGIKTVAVAGGVACNGYLRGELKRRFGADNVIVPPPSLCTDNGAMIAMAGYMMYESNRLRFPKMDPGRGI
ncbi:MAG: tRNA (adenosine(37)-N6)-threonylcarbamoyltransferase complex transferase subunit TsaD [Chitinispirillia bacterium]|nr:tRNA (adenosine(37)-N6)-threonylcarbamoyltransferase complex transferase subunit TsaD [Chitinispirillia bacterium]MCL2269299.1 tRNA (adenosine(37)-N6)-threonylcarbamoyltransferase complex transferase subunit TsaD [Chitinispirillia bacterium]